MSIKTSFVHSMKWTRGMLPVVFEEFGVFFIFDLFIYFFVTFFFSLSLSISKKSTLAKLEQLQPPPFSRFLRAWLFLSTFFRRFLIFSICGPLQFLKVDSPSFLYKPRFFVLYCCPNKFNKKILQVHAPLRHCGHSLKHQTVHFFFFIYVFSWFKSNDLWEQYIISLSWSSR